MKRELIVDCKSGGTRAAVLEDGELVELHLESGAPDGQTETLYYGRVQAVRPSVHAAFVEIGQELNAFLPLEEGMKIKGGDMPTVIGLATTNSREAITGKAHYIIDDFTGMTYEKMISFHK